MTYHTDRQYRAVSTAETSADDPLSVRAIQDLADDVNNYIYHVGNYKFVSELFIPAIGSLEAATTERVILHLGLHYYNNNYNNILWTLNSKLTTGTAAGGDEVDWNLYISDNVYDGDDVYDSIVFSNPISATITTASENNTIQQQSITLDLPYSGLKFFTLCTLNQNVTVLARATAVSLDLQWRRI